MSLADRLNQIIKEQKLTKKEFAAKLNITENYVYLLTGNWFLIFLVGECAALVYVTAGGHIFRPLTNVSAAAITVLTLTIPAVRTTARKSEIIFERVLFIAPPYDLSLMPN